MSPRARLLAAVALVLVTAPADAQLPAIAVRPEIGIVVPGRFYAGPVSKLYSGSYPATGTVRLEPALAWGAHVRFGPAASRWRFALDGATATTWSIVRARFDSSGSVVQYGVRSPARLTTFALGLEHPLRAPAARLGLVGRVGASIASTTFEPRRYPASPFTFEKLALIEEQHEKPFNRRYVSPGAVLGLDAAWRVAGRVALTAAGSLAAVRNDTGDMATGGVSEARYPIDRRETYWMLVPRLSLGLTLAR